MTSNDEETTIWDQDLSFLIPEHSRQRQWSRQATSNRPYEAAVVDSPRRGERSSQATSRQKCDDTYDWDDAASESDEATSQTQKRSPKTKTGDLIKAPPQRRMELLQRYWPHIVAYHPSAMHALLVETRSILAASYLLKIDSYENSSTQEVIRGFVQLPIEIRSRSAYAAVTRRRLSHAVLAAETDDLVPEETARDPNLKSAWAASPPDSLALILAEFNAYLHQSEHPWTFEPAPSIADAQGWIAWIEKTKSDLPDELTDIADELNFFQFRIARLAPLGSTVKGVALSSLGSFFSSVGATVVMSAEAQERFDSRLLAPRKYSDHLVLRLLKAHNMQSKMAKGTDPSHLVILCGESGAGKTLNALRTFDFVKLSGAVLYACSSSFSALEKMLGDAFRDYQDQPSPSLWNRKRREGAKTYGQEFISALLCELFSNKVPSIVNMLQRLASLVLDEFGGFPNVVRFLCKHQFEVRAWIRETFKVRHVAITIAGTGLSGRGVPSGSHPGTYRLLDATESGVAIGLDVVDRAPWKAVLAYDGCAPTSGTRVARSIISNPRCAVAFMSVVDNRPASVIDFTLALMDATCLETVGWYTSLNSMADLTMNEYRIAMAMAACAMAVPDAFYHTSADRNLLAHLITTCGVLVDRSVSEPPKSSQKDAWLEHVVPFGNVRTETFFLRKGEPPNRRFALSMAQRSMWLTVERGLTTRGGTPDDFEVASADATLLLLHCARANFPRLSARHYDVKAGTTSDESLKSDHPGPHTVLLLLKLAEMMNQLFGATDTETSALELPVCSYVDCIDGLESLGLSPRGGTDVESQRAAIRAQNKQLFEGVVQLVCEQNRAVIVKKKPKAPAQDTTVIYPVVSLGTLHGIIIVSVQSKLHTSKPITGELLAKGVQTNGIPSARRDRFVLHPSTASRYF